MGWKTVRIGPGRRGPGRCVRLGWILACVASASQATEPTVRSRYLMGTTCTATCYGSAAAAAAALDRIAAVEAVLSTWRDDTELSRINGTAAEAPAPLSDEMAAFLADTLRLAASSGGAFDPTVGPLVDLWDLRGSGRVPSDAELQQVLGGIGYHRIALDPQKGVVSYRAPGLWLDPGAIGKGFALERAAAELRSRGVGAALIDFGGQLFALGAPPNEDAWIVAVADPAGRDRPALLLRLRDASSATSAQSERGARAEGRWLGHILDPRSGRPVERAGSVTVIAPSATDADALATALFVMGPEEGLAWAEEHDEIAVGFLQPSADGARLRLRANDRFRGLVTARREFVETEPGEGTVPSAGEQDRREQEDHRATRVDPSRKGRSGS